MRVMEEEEGGKRVSCWVKKLPPGYMLVGLPKKKLVQMNVLTLMCNRDVTIHICVGEKIKIANYFSKKANKTSIK